MTLLANSVKLTNNDGFVDTNNPLPVSTVFGVPVDFTKQTSSSGSFLIQKGQVNNHRLRPQILNEHVETARQLQATVTPTNSVGQIFKASQDNINGINLTLESAGGSVFDNFESYADDSALQTAWVANDELATIEQSIVYEGSQSMKLDFGGVIGDDWVRTIPATNFEGTIGNINFYQNRSYTTVKARIFLGDGTNTKSAPLIAPNENEWFQFTLNEAQLTEDGAGITDATNITKVGFRIEQRRSNSFVYIDNMISNPPAGCINLELWDMGATIPEGGVTSIDDGTQYVELGDKGINGGTVSASITFDLVGGKRLYNINKFVAGTALEIPDNTLLNVDNYYAIVLKYVDTEIDVYGSDTSFETNYYNNGYSFTFPNNSTPITKLGEYNDLQFAIFSTQDVYLNTLLKFYDAVPGINATESLYIEDKEMNITDVIAGDNTPQQTLLIEFRDRVFWFPKGGKFEVNQNDDFSDSTTQITILIGYIYKPPVVNG